MRDLKHARMLLGLAHDEVAALRNMRERAEFADAIFGFHAQQTVEKALKALLSFRGLKYDYVHDLRAFYEQLGEAGEPGLAPFHPLMSLTPFAVQFRYEAYDDEPLDRAAILEDVTRLVALVEGRLKAAETVEES